jgi:hypothetical protein
VAVEVVGNYPKLMEAVAQAGLGLDLHLLLLPARHIQLL